MMRGTCIFPARLVSVKFYRSISTTTINSSSAEAIINRNKFEYYKNLNAQHLEKSAVPLEWHEALPFQAVPGPKRLPIVGTTWKFIMPKFFKKDLRDILEILNEEYGDIYVLRRPNTEPVVHIFNPNDIEKLHRNEGPWPIRWGLSSFADYRNVVRKDLFQGIGGVLTVHGEEWFKFRTILNPVMLKPKNVFDYTDKMEVIASQLVDNMIYFASKDNNREMPDNFLDEIYKWSFESISVVTLDRHLGCLKRGLNEDSEPARLIRAVLDMSHLLYKLDIKPSIWKSINSANWKRYVQYMDYLTDTNLRIINEVKSKIEEEANKSNNSQSSVLRKLLTQNEKLAITMAIDMLIGGVDTTGRVLSAALYFLAKHKDKQDRLREEVLALLPSKQSPITPQVLGKAQYLKAVLRETTRIAPISLANKRTTVHDIVLGGYQIPKGTQVLMNNLVISNQEKYVPRAKEFLPERWLRTGEHPFKNQIIFQPFGVGPRSCLGRRVANLELEVTLLKVIRNLELSWHHEDMVFRTRLFYGIGNPLKLCVSPID